MENEASKKMFREDGASKKRFLENGASKTASADTSNYQQLWDSRVSLQQTQTNAVPSAVGQQGVIAVDTGNCSISSCGTAGSHLSRHRQLQYQQLWDSR